MLLLFMLSQDVTYIQQNTPTTPTNSESEGTPSLSHATRVSPATVNFEHIFVKKIFFLHFLNIYRLHGW